MARTIFLLPLLLTLAACGMTGGDKPGEDKPAAAAPAEIPAAVRGNFDAATAAMKAQQWSTAEVQLQQVIRAQPQLSGAYLNLALLYMQTGRNGDAETPFRKAIEVNPENWSARDQYGIWLRTQGRFKDAETVYLQTLQRQPQRADTHLNLAILYDLYVGNGGQALAHYQQFLALKDGADDAETGRVKNWVADLQRRKGGA